MTNYKMNVERVFYALSDPTRRAVLEKLSQSEASVSELARPFEMALPSFLQHLKVLETNGLVTSRKEGRQRIYQLQPQTLAQAEDWLNQRRRLWSERCDRLDAYLKTMKD